MSERDWFTGLERPLEERTFQDDISRTFKFAQLMCEKWQKGRGKHGLVGKVDPLDEAMKECVDLANYAMETYYRIARLKLRLESMTKGNI